MMSAHFAVAQPVPQQALPLGNGLTTTNGQYVLGVLDRGETGRNLYLLDAQTGAVWFWACISWDKAGKCNLLGFRTANFGDGSGDMVFDSAKEATGARVRR